MGWKEIKTVVSEVTDILLREVLNIDDIRIEKVCLGLGYTGVMLEGGQMGVSHSLLSEMAPSCCQIITQAGRLAGRKALELLHLASSWDLGERVVGVATMNALSQIVLKAHPDRYVTEGGNLIDLLEVGRDDVVVMVGLIKPFISTLRTKAEQFYVLERGSLREEGVLPDAACEEIVPKADVVIITGSSLANGTIDRLLELSGNARTIALVGPTVGCVPDPLFRRRVHYASGIKIHDPEKAMRIIMEGGGTPQLRQAAEFITYKAK